MRMDTAYSPRLHEEELSATAERILFRVVGMWLPKIAGKNPFDGGDFGAERRGFGKKTSLVLLPVVAVRRL